MCDLLVLSLETGIARIKSDKGQKEGDDHDHELILKAGRGSWLITSYTNENILLYCLIILNLG